MKHMNCSRDLFQYVLISPISAHDVGGEFSFLVAAEASLGHQSLLRATGQQRYGILPRRRGCDGEMLFVGQAFEIGLQLHHFFISDSTDTAKAGPPTYCVLC